MAQKHSIEIPGAVGRSFVLLRPSAVFLLTAGVFVKPSSRHAAAGPWDGAFLLSVPDSDIGTLKLPIGRSEAARRNDQGLGQSTGRLRPHHLGHPGAFLPCRDPDPLPPTARVDLLLLPVRLVRRRRVLRPNDLPRLPRVHRRAPRGNRGSLALSVSLPAGRLADVARELAGPDYPRVRWGVRPSRRPLRKNRPPADPAALRTPPQETPVPQMAPK